MTGTKSAEETGAELLAAAEQKSKAMEASGAVEMQKLADEEAAAQASSEAAGLLGVEGDEESKVGDERKPPAAADKSPTLLAIEAEEREAFP